MSKARDLAAIGALSLALLAALEGGLRAVRSLQGEPTSTRVARFDADMRRALEIYRRHPFTNTGPRRGASTVAFGRSVSFNSLGYRSPERPLAKPPGTRRVLCAGGSTTFDLAAAEARRPSTSPRPTTPPPGRRSSRRGSTRRAWAASRSGTPASRAGRAPRT